MLQITIPLSAHSVTIASDGMVSYTLPWAGRGAERRDTGLSSPILNAVGLNSLGQNLYLARPPTRLATRLIGNPGGQEGMGTLLQGYTEQSNVSVVDPEFVNLIMSQRTYEANSKVVTAADQMYQK